MGYDDDRERRRMSMNRENEYRRGDFNRPSGGYQTTGWRGESSWGYGREYDERYPPRYERPSEEISETFSRSERFEDSGRPDRTGGETEFHPPAIRRYESESPFPYGAGYGYGYGTSSHLLDVPRGRFTGKGPKGYQRSDERIHEDVSEELAQHGEIDATDIQVRVSKREVSLDGEVETREQKRLAEDIVEACPGVREVQNNLHVRKGFFARLFGIEDDNPARV
jgi:hypothetical protein